MKRTILAFLIAFTVIALDQATKYLVVRYLGSYDAIEIFPFLHIVSVRNTGAAFGMFKSLGSNFFVIVSAAAIVFLVYLIRKNAYNLLGLSLILGGAVGNLIDRLFHGKVVDFIDFSVGSYHWPSFNVADSALSVGIVIILLTSLLKK
jgi:signal peptidase II